MAILYSLAGVGLLVSTIASRKKTLQALKTALKTFLKMLPLLLVTLSIVSIVLYFLPSEVIAKYLGTSDKLVGGLLAMVIGSISLLPGFITFPLCGLLLKQGVGYTILAAFTTSLMMVGIVTFPLESEYFGKKIALYRNIAALIIAIIVSIAIGILYGEVL